MAEASFPSAARSAHKPLQYTSCIDATVSSSTAVSSCGNINAHSSFDFISEPRDCNALVSGFDRAHRMLERDLRRIDMHEANYKKLDRTESISLPSTPIEHLSSNFHRPITLAASTRARSNEDDDYNIDEHDNDDDGQGEEHFSFNSSVDYMSMSPEPATTTDGSMSSSKSTLQLNCATCSSADANIPFSHGVDWTERACSTSHCWFAFAAADPVSSPACSFFGCHNPKPALPLALVQCESCGIFVHTHHLSEKSAGKFDAIPACRPSFFDNGELDESDQHFWSNVSALSKPCVLCKRKSTNNSFFGGNNRPSTMPTLDIVSKGFSYAKSPIADNSRTITVASGLQCLWCGRGYHRRCWEQAVTSEDKKRCDYGIFRHIIVRPQWIRRLPGYTPLFRAQYPSAADEEASYYTPLLLFINKRSGGQSGEKIYRKLLRLLNPRQVFLLENDQTIIEALDIYSSLSNIRICVFGGDGTVGWVLGRLAEIYPSLTNPPVCICPLGTGNDLSRVLSWGEQYDPKRLIPILVQIPRAQPIILDRWQVVVEPLDSTGSNVNLNSSGRSFLSFITHPKFIRDTTRASYQTHQTLPNSRFINYMSFGLDAAIALEFHHRRTRNPRKFSSPLKNKLIYLNESCKYLNDFARSRLWNLSSYIRLICDGEDLTDSIKNCHTLLVLNIPGYASGTNPWGKTSANTSSSPPVNIQKDCDSFEQISTSSVDLADLPANAHDIYDMIVLNECATDPSGTSPIVTTTITTTTTANVLPNRFERQDFGDRKIEVVGLSTTHMATIHIGFRGIRIAQCSELRIESYGPMTAQMDGEPFYIPQSAAFNITHAGQVLVLRNENR